MTCFVSEVAFSQERSLADAYPEFGGDEVSGSCGDGGINHPGLIDHYYVAC